MKYKLYSIFLCVFGSSVLTHSLPLSRTPLPQRFGLKHDLKKKRNSLSKIHVPKNNVSEGACALQTSELSYQTICYLKLQW